MTITKFFSFFTRILSVCVAGVLVTTTVPATALTVNTARNTQRGTAYTVFQTLDNVCSSTNPIRGCGTYQSDINNAAQRATALDRRIKALSNREAVYSRVMKRIVDVFYFAQTTRQKVAAAYYYVYFSQYTKSDDVENFVDDLFDNRIDGGVGQYMPAVGNNGNSGNNNSGSTTKTLLLSSQNSNTTINNTRREIEWEESYRPIEVSINDRNVRRGIDLVVATLNGRTFGGRSINQTVAASQDRNGTWRLELGSGFAGVDTITFSTLCKNCSSIYSASLSGFNGYRVMSTQSFEVEYGDNGRASNDRYNNRYDERYNDRNYGDTFEVRSIDAEWYYGNRDEREFEVSIGLENNTNDDIVFDIQNLSLYTPRLLRSSDYNWFVEEVDCDGSSRSTRQNNIRIEEDEQCEIRLTATVDEDEIDTDEVELIAEFYDRTNRKTVSIGIELDGVR